MNRELTFEEMDMIARMILGEELYVIFKKETHYTCKIFANDKTTCLINNTRDNIRPTSVDWDDISNDPMWHSTCQWWLDGSVNAIFNI